MFNLWPKDCPIKKETNLEAYISVNFLHISTNSAPQIMQIFPAFHRDALWNCDFNIKETIAISVKLDRNWNVQFSYKFNQFFC